MLNATFEVRTKGQADHLWNALFMGLKRGDEKAPILLALDETKIQVVCQDVKDYEKACRLVADAVATW